MDIFNNAERQVVCVANDVQSTFPGFEDNTLLTVGEKYTVIDVEVHSWHTLITLREFPNKRFNSVLFEEIDEKEKSKMQILPQYHFERDDFCKVFMEVFTYDEFVDIDVLCGTNAHFDDFSLFRCEDEFYILHRDSGILINWYKHMGRTNTCNKPDFTLDDFREFLKKLREELVWAGKIKDEALRAKLYKEFYE